MMSVVTCLPGIELHELMFVFIQYPETAPFLTERERAWLVQTLKADNTGLSKELKWRFLAQALRDPHSYLMISLLFLYAP